MRYLLCFTYCVTTSGAPNPAINFHGSFLGPAASGETISGKMSMRAGAAKARAEHLDNGELSKVKLGHLANEHGDL